LGGLSGGIGAFAEVCRWVFALFEVLFGDAVADELLDDDEFFFGLMVACTNLFSFCFLFLAESFEEAWDDFFIVLVR
jgi:hypothetical protein